jgi:hypothetical protein
MFSLLSSLVSDNCHGQWATHHVKAIPRCVHRRAGVRTDIPAEFHFCLSQNISAGRVHYEGAGRKYLRTCDAVISQKVATGRAPRQPVSDNIEAEGWSATCIAGNSDVSFESVYFDL